MLGFSSTVLAAKVLEGNRELRSVHGRVAIGILIVQDIVAVALLAIINVETPSPWALLLLLLAVRAPRARLVLDFCGHGELLVLYGAALALGGGEGFGYLGLSPELGALVLGLLLADHRRAQELTNVLWGLKELFLAGFFLNIGLSAPPTWEALRDGAWLLADAAVPGHHLLPVADRLGVARTHELPHGVEPHHVQRVRADRRRPRGQERAARGHLARRGGVRGEPVVRGRRAADRVRTGASTRRSARGSSVSSARSAIPTTSRSRSAAPRYSSSAWAASARARTTTCASRTRTSSASTATPAKIESNIKQGRRVAYADAEDPSFWLRLNLDRLRAIMLALPSFEAKISAARALRRRGFKGLISATHLYPEEYAPIIAAGCDVSYNYYTEAGVGFARHTYETLTAPRGVTIVDAAPPS